MSSDEKGANPPLNRQMNVIISRKPKIDDEKIFSSITLYSNVRIQLQIVAMQINNTRLVTVRQCGLGSAKQAIFLFCFYWNDFLDQKQKENKKQDQ